MRHRWSYHTDILHTETPTLTEARPLDNYGSVVGYMLPDRLHEPFSCLQGNGRWSGTLWNMFEFFWKFQYDCNGLVSGSLSRIICLGHEMYPIAILCDCYRR